MLQINLTNASDVTKSNPIAVHILERKENKLQLNQSCLYQLTHKEEACTT